MYKRRKHVHYEQCSFLSHFSRQQNITGVYWTELLILNLNLYRAAQLYLYIVA